MSKVLRLKGGVVALACALLLLVAWYLLRSPSDPSGPYSALTRSKLKIASAGGEVFVPVSLPPGLNASASSSDFLGSYEVKGKAFRGDEVAFFLGRVLAAPDLPEHRREVVTQYQSGVLDASGKVLYEVHQLPEGMRTAGRCGPSAGTPIERSRGTTRLLICSSDLRPGTKARTYWTAVSFTNQLESVDWLRGDL